MSSLASPAPACPTWCNPSLDHALQNGPGRRHSHELGGLWLREHRAVTGRVVRPPGGQVYLELRLDEDHAGERTDAVVAVGILGELGRESRLTAPEARSLAALLVAGADRLEGLR